MIAVAPETQVRPPVALTAEPAHVMLKGSARAAIRVTNAGRRRVLVDVRRAGFALDLHGRPHIVRSRAARSAATWLRFRPARFALAPRGSVSVAVAARLPHRPEPGDHDALVLLSTRPTGDGRVAVRVRMGVVVVVRAPGTVVRRLELRRLRVVSRGRGRVLRVIVANRGNVTESLPQARAVVSRVPGGRPVATVAAPRRELRPRTRGIIEFALRRAARGAVQVEVVIPQSGGRAALRRTYRIRL